MAPLPYNGMGMGVPAGQAQAIYGVGGNALTAAGTTISDATTLSADYNRFSTTAASTGAKLPVCAEGACVVIANDGAQTLTVYPSSSGAATIDGATTVTIATTKRRIFYGVTATVWVSVLGA